MSATLETATFAAGCFWGVEDAFRAIEGVKDAEVGYTNGHTQAPTYEAVCRKNTGHAEAVRVSFDPAVVSYAELLDVFWAVHDPTQLNRQGPDIGDQYRSAIFTHGDNQAAQALESKNNASAKFDNAIVTQIEPAAKWWRAEEYHQQYFAKKGIAGCAIHQKK